MFYKCVVVIDFSRSFSTAFCLIKNITLQVKKAHHIVHRLPKVILKNDTDYLRQVPKSRYYHLIGVEELMKNRGMLKQKYFLFVFQVHLIPFV